MFSRHSVFRSILNSQSIIFYSTGIVFEKFKDNPNVVLLYTQKGGHYAFCENFIPTGCNWVCHVLSDYLETILAVKTNYCK
jgi:predicted alpha/beta-fold hydrolase